MFSYRSIVAVAASAFLGVPAMAWAQLNVVCSAPPEWCKPLADEFEKDTGVKVVLVAAGGREAFAMLAEQGSKSRTDIWFGGPADIHVRATKFNLLEEYASPMAAQLEPWAQKVAEQSKSRSVGVYARVLGIGYNATLATQKKLAAPACWKDLIKPGFAGEVHIADPNTSVASNLAIGVMTQIFGEDQAFKDLKAMYKAPPSKKGQVAAEAKSGASKSSRSANIAAASKAIPGKGVPGKTAAGSATPANASPPVGDAMAGIGFVDEIVAEAESGTPVKAVAPCEGTISDVGAVSIVKSSSNLGNAKKFVDWVLGAKAQALVAKGRQYAYPANTSVATSALAPKYSEVKFVTNDNNAKHERSGARRKLLDRWKHEIAAPAP